MAHVIFEKLLINTSVMKSNERTQKSFFEWFKWTYVVNKCSLNTPYLKTYRADVIMLLEL